MSEDTAAGVERDATSRKLERLLIYLRDSRGFDFTGYKRASIARRVQRRMDVVGLEDFEAYLELLEANPSEFAELFDTILINVTSFARDREAWELMRHEILPALAAARDEGAPLRVWCAGMASGQEAYTIAVLLAEELGEERFRSTVKIYATDVDNEALVTARQGRYPTSDVVSAFGEERATRLFERDGSTSAFRQELRRSLIFGRHDLVHDPPISRIDLLICRNTLMYFLADVQRRVLAGFQFALSPGGVLFLGKAEAMLGRNDAYETVSSRYRIFRKRASSVERSAPVAELPPLRYEEAGVSALHLLRVGFEESPVAQIVVDAAGTVLGVNEHARQLFGLGADSAGRNFKDLTVSSRPLELRSLLEEVTRTGRPSVVHDVPCPSVEGGDEYLDVLLRPLDHGRSTGATITFMEVGRNKLLRDELERSQRELASAYEELQSTVEELETMNEELQSTNEELETTNEELHSANEELETMNEELQSTNEELETANQELRERGTELNELNRFLGSVLGSLSSGLVVLAPDMSVRAWNRRSEDLWGLRSDEVLGRHLLELDIGLPVERLRVPIRSALQDASLGETITLSALTRRGHSIQCQVQVIPLERSGVILIVDEL